ncbi:hypothetical protein WL44_15355 [Burkholderia ubonensis]|nr:hypothetical protein WL44_15355 [Burkholderia ubonensis]
MSTYSGPDIGQPVVNNLNNNVYVRCKNLSAGAMTGNANLYYADASLFLLPNTWTPITLPQANNNFVTTSGAPSTSIPEGAVAIVQAPFTFGGVPVGPHFCFIAVVNNNNVPFPVPPSFTNNAAFATWVSNNPNVAYRNIVLNAGSNANITSYQTFGNANPIPNTFIFSMVGTNLPSGARWSAQCTDVRLPQPFLANGTFSSSGTAGTQLTVPANIGGGNPLMSMAFTFSTANGQPFPSNASVIVTYYQVPTSNAESPELVEAESKAIREHHVAAMSSGAVGFEALQLIVLGSIAVQLSYGG